MTGRIPKTKLGEVDASEFCLLISVLSVSLWHSSNTSSHIPQSVDNGHHTL
jgi:hypothetical protein